MASPGDPDLRKPLCMPTNFLWFPGPSKFRPHCCCPGLSGTPPCCLPELTQRCDPPSSRSCTGSISCVPFCTVAQPMRGALA